MDTDDEEGVVLYSASITPLIKLRRILVSSHYEKNTHRKMSSSSFLGVLPLLFVGQLIMVPGSHGQNPDGTSTGVTQSSSLPAGYVAYPDIGSAYKVHNENHENSTTSEELCVLEGGHLAVIDSEKKLEYALRPPIEGSFVKRHVGIRLVNENWVSIDNGRTLSSIPWARSEPFPHPRYTCAAIGYEVKDRRIMSEPCDFYGDFVCEIPLPPAA